MRPWVTRLRVKLGGLFYTQRILLVWRTFATGPERTRLKFIADETEKWGKAIRAANIKVE
jgi:hypothetical protein